MKKFWMVAVTERGRLAKCVRCDGVVTSYGPMASKAEAVDEMKRKAGADKNGQYDYFILEALSSARTPVPEIEVVELKA